MSNPALTARSWKPQLRFALTALVWTALLLLAAYFFLKFGLRYFNLDESFGGPWARKSWLLLHIVGGGTALFTGLPQFWTGLRKRHVRVHRWMGRLYLGGIALGTVAAVGLFPHISRGWGWKVATASMGMVWITAATLAYVAILRGRTKAHRDWMIRSYVVTFQFVVLRLLFEFPYIANAGETFTERLTAMAWFSWTIPLFFAEVALQWRSTMGPAPGADAVRARATTSTQAKELALQQR